MSLLGSKRLRHQWLGFSIFVIAATVVLKELVSVPLKQFSVVHVSVPTPPDWFGEWRPMEPIEAKESRKQAAELIQKDQLEVYRLGEQSLNNSADMDSTDPVSSDDSSGSVTVHLAPEKASPAVQLNQLQPGWQLQVASFIQKDNALSLQQDLLKQGFRVFIQSEVLGDQTFNRVYVGPELKRADSESQRSLLKEQLQLDAVLKPYVPKV